MASTVELLETGTNQASSVRDVFEGSVAKLIDKRKRFDTLMASFNTTADTPLKRGIRTAVKFGVKPFLAMLAGFIWLLRKIVVLYHILPHNVLQMIFGIGLCFFGGVYFTAIAAVEALVNFGGVQLWDELKVVYDDCCQIADASAVDDTVDADHDGIADVQQISYSELLSRKATVAMVAVKDPQRLMKALSFFMTAYLSVIATLKFEFARTVALCLAVVDMVKVPICCVFGPLLSMILGPKLNHWVEALVMTLVKLIAIIAACYVQAVISAFYSGIRGGQLFAVGFINFMGVNGYMDKISCIQKPFDADKTYLDEAIAYPLAAIGFFYQWHVGFSLSFPLSLILLPCTIVEWILRWQVFA